MSSCAARAGLIAAAACSAIRAIASTASTPTPCPTTTSYRASACETGAHIWIVETRRAPNAAIDQTVKNFNRMDLTKGTFEALDQGADAAVLLSTEGYVAEGPGFNVWIVRGNALAHACRQPTRRDHPAHGFRSRRGTGRRMQRQRNLQAEDLSEANEAFLSTTAGGIIPITRVNDRPLGNGAPG